MNTGWNVLTENLCIADCQTGCRWDGGDQAELFVGHCVQVRKLVERRGCYVIVVGEMLAKLCAELLLDGGIDREEPAGPGERAGCGFMAF